MVVSINGFIKWIMTEHESKRFWDKGITCGTSGTASQYHLIPAVPSEKVT